MNFEDCLKRAEFISLQDFLQTGGETLLKSSSLSYSEQIEEAQKKAKAFFDEKFTDLEEHDKITEYFYQLVGVHEEVFFEIGAILGAKIGMQLQKRLQELA